MKHLCFSTNLSFIPSLPPFEVILCVYPLWSPWREVEVDDQNDIKVRDSIKVIGFSHFFQLVNHKIENVIANRLKLESSCLLKRIRFVYSKLCYSLTKLVIYFPISSRIDIGNFTHLQGLKLANSNKHRDVLIGADQYCNIATGRVRNQS